MTDLTERSEHVERVPGDPQYAHGDILRAGFEEACLGENWASPRKPA